MTDAGLDFRATKDLDIVLLLESLSPAFVRAFWEFIRLGNYENREKASGGKQYYRFTKPTNPEFPIMLELFSRVPDALELTEGTALTPIPMGEEASSLSAILLDEAYYGFLQSGKKQLEGLSTIGAEHLMSLKAKAWMDLAERRDQGESIDRRNILKHKNDFFRLYRIADPDFAVAIPEAIQADMERFLVKMETENIDLKSLGMRGLQLDFVLNDVRRIFRIK